MDDDSGSKIKNFYRKNQEELDKLGMRPRPLAEEGIDVFKDWEKELFKRRDEYDRKNVPVIEDIEEEVPIQQFIKKPIDKNKLNIYVKLMSGDIIPLEVNSNSKISTIKEIIKNELKSQINVNNIRQIVLFDNEGNYLKDEDIIKKILSENDMINVFINVSDDPPFKEEKWIKLNYSTLKELKDFKIQTKKLNPTMKHDRWTTFYSETFRQHLGETDNINMPVQIYEGTLDNFLSLPGVTDIVLLPEFNRHMIHSPNLSLDQQRNLREFIESIEELGYDNLKYVYGVYNLYSLRSDKKIEFIATNNDSSIAYELDDGIHYVYINGFKIYLGQWMAMSKNERLRFLKYV